MLNNELYKEKYFNIFLENIINSLPEIIKIVNNKDGFYEFFIKCFENIC